LSSRDPVRRDADDPPVYFWQVGPTGTVVAASSGAPQLPRDLATRSRQFPRTESIEGSSFRFGAVQRADGTELIAAESLAQQGHVRRVLLTSALAVSPLDRLTNGRFEPVLADSQITGDVKRIVFTTGKVYYTTEVKNAGGGASTLCNGPCSTTRPA